MSTKGQYEIAKECSEYLLVYNGPPLIKWIPVNALCNDDIIKIKLRHKKSNSTFDDFFNFALSQKKLRQRALFIKDEPIENHHPYFIIPPNGYKILYSLLVSNSKELEEKLFNPLLSLNCHETIKSLFKEILELHYCDDDPSEAIVQNNEVILYNIPYVYGIKKGKADFNTIKNMIINESEMTQ